MAESALRTERQFDLPFIGSGEPPVSSIPALPVNRERKPRQSKAPKVSLDLLTLPLFDQKINIAEHAILLDHEQEAAENAVELKVGAILPSNMDDEDEAVEPWTNDGIARLMGVLLEESLAALAARGNAKQKQEILDWVFEADCFQRLPGQWRARFTNTVPFSFAFCCKLAGMDPDVIRDFLRQRISALA